ncbi:MAG: hypothetical protein OXC26_17550 [Albidovulum sp.]|nr:hypothetical protein [Albidovulum sp.]
MGLILETRKNDAIGAALRARNEANKHGMLHSSRTDLGVKGAYEETYDDICRDAWSELHHIAITVGVKPNEGLVDELRAVFDEVMKPLAERLFTANRQRAPRCVILLPRVLHRFPKATHQRALEPTPGLLHRFHQGSPL